MAALAALGGAAWPREACALLVGLGDDDGLRVTELVPAGNVAATPEREFELDPAVHFATLRRLRDADGTNPGIGHSDIGPRIIGHWHSHPNGRAEPSAQDVAMISDPGLVWLISAVHDGQASPVRAFRAAPKGDGFEFLPLTIEQQD
ncbi:MAG: M67 family metallopeptidase [Ferrovibrio sp.]|uniref:M67 family metallopeptidase n=1 Tax=Ferrovibrio sp. TaxID=1917215 RepID=UPI00261B2205|nr:M67 family metallopeptidase [Ferrovibrio sp.]MCW0235618.1 M67 family metallopeptidase [Ferrovibrio sp.]